MPGYTVSGNNALTTKHSSEQQRNIELITIYEISKLLGSSLDLSKTLRAILNLLSVNLKAWRGLICLEEDDGELGLVAVSGVSPELLTQERYQVGEGLTGRIFKSGMPIVAPDVSKEPLFLNRWGTMDDSKDRAVAFIGVPIKAAQATLGVLSFMRLMDDRAKHSFDHDVLFLTMVANLIGQTVRLYRSINAERKQLLEEKRMLKKELQRRYSIDNVIGSSKAMQEVFAEVHQSAPSRSTVLLRGESGTGKEVIARAIHFLSTRKDGPFIKLNCAALSESLLESELFGHEKGAFTGAHAGRKGRFELAHGGTLFLDEIGDISPAFQAKLLRVLQEREFERVGGTQPIKVNVRLITATNRDLEQAVTKGDFRADLYYRINVVSIFIPPLRERREDIPLLVEHFLERFNRENKRNIRISPDAMSKFRECNWPGNVRELENCIERTATMVQTDLIDEADLSCMHSKCMGQLLHFRPAAGMPVTMITPVSEADSDDAKLPEHENDTPVRHAPATERERLIWALEQCGWVQAKAARLLNISARQMGYALMKHNIEVKKF